MAEESQKPPEPSPDANWKQFTTGLPGFVDALNDALGVQENFGSLPFVAGASLCAPPPPPALAAAGAM